MCCSAEELKAKVAEYGNENLPGWKVACISFRLGDGQLVTVEDLLALPEVNYAPPCQQHDGPPHTSLS